MVYMHHERWGGGGYPVGNVVAEEIPLLSRVLQICDGYEAMVAMDNYQLPLTYDQAMEVISREAGTMYDPQLAGRFAEMMRSTR
jgi:HD-GYP domain-containing protein (c-di-GMP phosphodiesterase class II)